MIPGQKDQPWQGTFDDLGRNLAQTTFVVIDLETSGGSPAMAGITEIGAVKVRGGEIIGEFQTLINPGENIPAFITVLTGITNAMVIKAPSIQETFPALLEFLGSPAETVIVAHNAPFDLGFLKGAAKNNQYEWPNFPVVDTARLARQVLTKDEVPNCKLGTLAVFFDAQTSPTHRALDDARATVDVLHGIFDRLGSFGVTTLEELKSFSTRITNAQRDKKYLASSIPQAPGVYIFRGAKNEPLYVGTSRNLKTRVRSYFTAAETRKRIHEMIALTDHVDTVVCATILEAQVRELRMINEHKPHYNKRSRFQEKTLWLKLRQKPMVRFYVVQGNKSIAEHEIWCGPFAGRDEAQSAMNAIHHHFLDVSSFSPSDLRDITQSLTMKMNSLSDQELFEEAVSVRNQISALTRGVSRGHHIRALTCLPEIIVAKPAHGEGQWEFACIRYGRLAGSAISMPGIDVQHTIESLVLTSEVVIDDGSILPASSHEEVEKLLTFIDSEGVRIVSIKGQWALPIFGSTAPIVVAEQMHARYQ